MSDRTMILEDAAYHGERFMERARRELEAREKRAEEGTENRQEKEETGGKRSGKDGN